MATTRPLSSLEILINQIKSQHLPRDVERQLIDSAVEQEARSQHQQQAKLQSQTTTNMSTMYGGVTISSMGTHSVPARTPVTVTQAFEAGKIGDFKVGDIVGKRERPSTQYEVVRIREDGNLDVIHTSGTVYNNCEPDCFVMVNKKPVKKIKLDRDKLEALVISEEAKEEIVAVLDQHTHHDKLFTEWGLGEVIEYGKGMTFLFYGLPGTGKTWGANCIAKAMGMELLTISASEIQSSEPGGANRAIEQAFKTAKEEKKVIFLDECDSLIASRNDLGMILASEVNTLLTEIEKFEGVCVLATNRIENMDEALERRISLIVEFPKPDFQNRKKIWTKLLPAKLPLGKGVTAEKLAEEELTGGQIKNVVLQASRMALAGKCDKVEQKHFDLAVARIKKSKNLMGMASRYHQGRVKDDFSQSSGTKTKLTEFLKSGKKDANH